MTTAELAPEVVLTGSVSGIDEVSRLARVAAFSARAQRGATAHAARGVTPGARHRYSVQMTVPS